MSFSLPYSPKRRYLTGIDWIVGTMDRGAGCFSQAILELEGNCSLALLSEAVEKVSQRFPLLHGRIARDWLNLAPYWKVPAESERFEIKHFELSADAEQRSEELLDRHANEPLYSRSQHLRFILISLGTERSRLGMVFDHRLFDAFGAEGLLRLIHHAWEGKLEEYAPRIRQTEPAHLDHWKRRFESGQTLNRYLLKMNEQRVCALRAPYGPPRRAVRFVHEQMTQEETADFSHRAEEEIGMPILLPSAAARAVAATRATIPIPPFSGEQYLLFTTVNQRLPGQEWDSLFFNHLSLMTLSSGWRQPAGVPEIAAQMRDQFFEQTKLRIPFVMEDAGALGRICPHWLAGRFMRLVADGRLCSFYFVFLRENGFTLDNFLGLKVTNLFHKPLTFFPPGMNLCITSFGGRFNLVLSYVEGALSDGQARGLLGRFKNLMRQ